MTDKEAKPESIETVWRAVNLRLTVFFNPPIKVPENQWWNEVTDQNPDVDQNLPKEFRREVVGIWNDRRLALLLQPDRADWVLSTPDPDTEQIGDFRSLVQDFVGLLEGWLSKRSSIVRVAFGAIVNLSVPDVQAGYKKIAEYSPGLRFDENCSDFLYQMNRRRLSKTGIQNLTVNRLGRWSVMTKRSMQMSFGPEGSSVDFQPPIEFNCLLLMDVNTLLTEDLVLNGLPQDKLTAVLHELVDLSFEILEKGDVS